MKKAPLGRALSEIALATNLEVVHSKAGTSLGEARFTVIRAFQAPLQLLLEALWEGWPLQDAEGGQEQSPAPL